MRNVRAIMVAVCLCISVVGCSVQKKSSVEEKKKEVTTYGMVCDVMQIKEDAFTWSSWQGLEKAVEGEVAYKAKYLESSNEEEILPNLERLSDEGCTLIWGIGESLMEPMKESAALAEEVSYVLMDYAPDEGQKIPKNMTYIDYRTEQASFLAGYAAGYVTKTGRVGFVGGKKLKAVAKFEKGYTQGVKFAADEQGKTVDVQVEYTGSFEDTFYGETVGNKMSEGGCDVLFHAAGQSGLGVIKAAANADCWAIGVDVDQSKEAPKTVLLSVLKNTKNIVETVTKEFQEGKDIRGQTLIYGMEEDGVGITANNPNMDTYYPELYEKIMIVRDQILRGEIQVEDDIEEDTKKEE